METHTDQRHATLPLPRLHRDRTVTYWSESEGTWIEHSIYIPESDLSNLEEALQRRIRAHLGLTSLDPLA